MQVCTCRSTKLMCFHIGMARGRSRRLFYDCPRACAQNRLLKRVGQSQRGTCHCDALGCKLYACLSKDAVSIVTMLGVSYLKTATDRDLESTRVAGVVRTAIKQCYKGFDPYRSPIEASFCASPVRGMELDHSRKHKEISQGLPRARDVGEITGSPGRLSRIRRPKVLFGIGTPDWTASESDCRHPASRAVSVESCLRAILNLRRTQQWVQARSHLGHKCKQHRAGGFGGALRWAPTVPAAVAGRVV